MYALKRLRLFCILLSLGTIYIPSQGAEIKITFYETHPDWGSSGFKISDGNIILYVDAFTSTGSLQPGDVDEADIILITHDHSDHFDAATVAQVASNTHAFVVGPALVTSELVGQVPSNQLVTLQPSVLGAKLDTVLCGVNITAYYTDHDAGPGYQMNSYRIGLDCGATVFHSGDTEDNNWESLLVDYTELYNMNVLMATQWNNLQYLNNVYMPDVLIKMHISGYARVYTEYPTDFLDLHNAETYTYIYTGIEKSGPSFSNKNYKIYNIFPNPSTQPTTINYQLPAKNRISLKIYDISGRLVKTLVNEPKEAGYYTTNWCTKGIANGIYFCRLECNGKVLTQKLILVK